MPAAPAPGVVTLGLRQPWNLDVTSPLPPCTGLHRNLCVTSVLGRYCCKSRTWCQWPLLAQTAVRHQPPFAQHSENPRRVMRSTKIAKLRAEVKCDGGTPWERERQQTGRRPGAGPTAPDMAGSGASRTARLQRPAQDTGQAAPAHRRHAARPSGHQSSPGQRRFTIASPREKPASMPGKPKYILRDEAWGSKHRRRRASFHFVTLGTHQHSSR